MKRRCMVIVFAVALLCLGSEAFSQDDIAAHRDCAHCGMDRKAYGFSRMLVQFDDGTSVGVCSLHCVVIELDSNSKRGVKAVLAADRNTRMLINAEKAVWVMGGAKRGVMTERPKWAFESKSSAEAFIREQGGIMVTWDDALAAAREDAAREAR